MDIERIYQDCMASGVEDRITARTIYNYMVSPFMVYCDKFAPEEMKDPESAFVNLLFKKGNSHEKNVIETKYPDAEKLSYDTLEEGFKILLEEMAKGVRALCGLPAFYKPDGVMGKIDALERRDGESSIFGDYHYVVKEIKLAKNIKQHHVMQAALYNFIIGKIQGYTPPYFYIVNRDQDEFQVDYNEDKLVAILEEIKEIFQGKEVKPTYGAGQWPWETYNDGEA